MGCHCKINISSFLKVKYVIPLPRLYNLNIYRSVLSNDNILSITILPEDNGCVTNLKY